MEKLRFLNKVAIITGGGYGLGRTICLGFAKEGASVVIPDINFENARQTASEIIRNRGKALPTKTNIKEDSEVQLMVQETLKTFGRIDILVNNAGIVIRESLLDTTEEHWNNVIDTNLKGAYLVSKAVVPYMMENRCCKIVNIASIAGIRGLLSTPYTASKSGLIGLTRLWAGEFAKYHINVNCVAPGFIATTMNEEMRKSRLGKSLTRRLPFGWGKPEDIANAVFFLCSEESTYISGQTLIVDGGLTSFVDMGSEYRSFSK